MFVSITSVLRWASPLLLCVLLAACGSSKRSTSVPPALSPASDAWVQRYSQQLGIALPAYMPQKLVEEVATWMGTPYKYGGSTRQGADCSGFISQVFQAVYGVPLPRTAQAMYQASKARPAADAVAGDLVFFRINTPAVGHAGIYLCQGYFIHASTSRGVMVSRLDEAYWKKYFVAAGSMLP